MIETLFGIERLGVVMEPDPENPDEAWGVLNPTCARTRDGHLYLFPRVVAENNYSRIGIARVLVDSEGEPRGVERMGYVLEPTEWYEQNGHTAGCEDPRITYIGELGVFLMAYTAHGPLDARIALAVSEDLMQWRRLGLVSFTRSHGADFTSYTNKDGLIFPELIRDPAGRPSVALIHRPSYQVSRTGEATQYVFPRGISEQRPSMWISYCPVDQLESNLRSLTRFFQHELLAVPEQPWEALKIGGGAPPVLTDHGWVVLFHGVSGELQQGVDLQKRVLYCAGAFVLDHDDPKKVLYRSRTPILEPAAPLERQGIVNNVVFPTAVDVRADGRVDVYYGMADSRIGLGKLQVPASLTVQGPRIAA
jgi:beta-1,2-mannobiose phosphorylase / 1,2-beta-oligomannan phosphorylase